MSTQKMMRLTNTLALTARQSRDRSGSRSSFRSRISSQKQTARQNYKQLTNHTKQQQKQIVRSLITDRRPNWKHDYYRVNNTFNIIPKDQLDAFPHNNDKYNVQFLDRSLHGQNLKFPSKDWGYFDNPKDQLYSDHYKPIVRNKRSYNETYELRTSLFGKTWVDTKKDHIMDEYRLQANPFRTPASNTIISTMKKDRHNHRRL